MGERMRLLSQPMAGADISDDGLYRYRLWRTWDDDRPRMTWVMLNPSTADATVDDPTIRRCMGFARRDGYGGIDVVNLYAYRSPSPAVLGTVADPVGPRNYEVIAEVVDTADLVAVAWGAWTGTRRQQEVVFATMPDVPALRLVCLGKTKNGSPRHPLYVRSDQPWEVWP